MYLLVVLSPAGFAQGGASKVFHGRGSLKAQGVISSWVPELDPKSLGDSIAVEPFLQVPSIGREAEWAVYLLGCQNWTPNPWGIQMQEGHSCRFFQ